MTLSENAELRIEAPHPLIGTHAAHVANRLNWLRAGVLGANDGIVSTAGLVVGLAAATTAGSVVFAAGLAGLVAGAVSTCRRRWRSPWVRSCHSSQSCCRRPPCASQWPSPRC